MLTRFQEHELKLNPQRYLLFQREVEFLNGVLSNNSLPLSRNSLDKWPTPKSSRDLEDFMGYASHHKRLIKDFYEIEEPLYSVMGQKQFRWGEKEEGAFCSLESFDQSKQVIPPQLMQVNSQDRHSTIRQNDWG